MRTEEEIRKYIEGIEYVLRGDAKKFDNPNVHHLMACAAVAALKWVLRESPSSDEVAEVFIKAASHQHN